MPQFFINQGWRDARALATLDGVTLYEYRMPKGTTALTIEGVQTVSYPGLPLKWLREIVETGETWEGNPQAGTARHETTMSPATWLRLRTTGPTTEERRLAIIALKTGPHDEETRQALNALYALCGRSWTQTFWIMRKIRKELAKETQR